MNETTEQIMGPEHPEWNRFVDLLYGPQGCNVKQGAEWMMPITGQILTEHFPDIDQFETWLHFMDLDLWTDVDILGKYRADLL